MKKWLSLAIVPVVLAAVPVIAMAKSVDVNQIACGKNANPPKQESRVPGEVRGQEWRKAGLQDPLFQSVETRELFNKGQMALVDKKYPQAAVAFESVLREQPESIRTLHQLSHVYLQQGEFEKALDRVNKAISLDPVNTKLILTKAQILDGMKKDPEALEHYFIFSALDPTDSSAIIAERRGEELFRVWENRFDAQQKDYYSGLRFLTWNQPDAALPMLESFVRTYPNSVNGRMMLGMAHRELNHPQAAIEQFQAITRVEPTSAVGFYHLGVMYNTTGEQQQAKQAWNTFMKYAPRTEAVEIWSSPSVVPASKTRNN